jgi:outer membrane protein
MKMRLLFILVAVFVLNPYSLPAKEYSLNELYTLSLQKSELIRIAEEDVFISERGEDRAVSSFLPDLSAFGEHTRYIKEKRQSGFLLQPDYTNDWGLRLDQTFSLGGREFTSFRIAKEETERSRHELHSAKEEFLLTVATRFYAVLRAKKEVEITGANLERLTQYRNAAAKRLEFGEGTKTVLIRAEAELAGARSERIKSDNNLKISKTILEKTAGISGEYELKEPEPGVDYDLPEQGTVHFDFVSGDCSSTMLDCLKKTAFSERGELKSVEIQKKISEDEITFARGSYWPDLSLEGVYARQENEPASTFGLTERTYGVVKLNFPFFEGGLRKSEVSEARAKRRQAEYRYTDLKKRIGVEVENSYLIVIREASVLEHLKAEVEYATDNYTLVTKQFKHGLADSIDVIDANTLLVTAERDYTNARYVYQLALLRLKRATGKLYKSVIGDQHN